jgi:hypothetical protein
MTGKNVVLAFTGYWLIDTGCWLLDAGCWKNESRPPIVAIGYYGEVGLFCFHL